jgi:hypothetical protein
MDGDGLDPQLFAGSNHAQRDFPAIGDKNFLEHDFTPESR